LGAGANVGGGAPAFIASGKAMRAATGTKIAAMYHHSRPGVFILPYCQVVSGGSDGVVFAGGSAGVAGVAGGAGVVSAASVARAMTGTRRAGSSAAGVGLLVLTPLVLAAPDASRRDEDVRAAIFWGRREKPQTKEVLLLRPRACR
jgi:hypothetical protein